MKAEEHYMPELKSCIGIFELLRIQQIHGRMSKDIIYNGDINNGTDGGTEMGDFTICGAHTSHNGNIFTIVGSSQGQVKNARALLETIDKTGAIA